MRRHVEERGVGGAELHCQEHLPGVGDVDAGVVSVVAAGVEHEYLGGGHLESLTVI